MITAGGTEGMFDALLATTDPGDEVILTDPTYAGMTNRVRLAGGGPAAGAVRAGRRRQWSLDLDALRRAAGPRTRALFLMNPSMPSGAVLTPEAWAAVARICVERDCWLLYNAAMERILYDGRRGDPSRLAARHGGAHAGDRLDVEGIPDDRVAGWLGGGAASRSWPTSGGCTSTTS